jgi:hypothetical protein
LRVRGRGGGLRLRGARRSIDITHSLPAGSDDSPLRRHRVHFAVEPVLRRRGASGEAHLAALTSPHAPRGYDYAVTFKADTLLRTSYAGVVRQLGHELEHVKQFEQGIRDFARQEFLAYGCERAVPIICVGCFD